MKFRGLIVAMAMSLFSALPGITQAESFLEDEAGISASTHVTSVNLTLAATAFKAIEQQTSDYIIGSVALNDYRETDDVHVYLDTSGDMIAYYFKEEVTGTLIDWKHDTTGALSGGRLVDALSAVCAKMVVALPEVKYYDFRYPGATNIKIIADEKLTLGTETFRFLIPGNYVIHHSEYSHYITQKAYTTCSVGIPTLAIDDAVITNSSTTSSWNIWGGEISSGLLAPDVYHEFSVYNSDESCSCYGALILLYSVE